MNARIYGWLITVLFLVECGIAQWVQQNSGTAEKLTDVVMLDTTTAIVVGYAGSILKTTNSGATWIHKEPPIDILMKWNSMSFFDKLHGIVAGDSFLMTTTNGGEEWQLRSISGTEIFLATDYRGLNHIYVGDDSGRIYQSIDTGKTWSSKKITTGRIMSIFYYTLPIMSWRPVYALTNYAIYSTKFYDLIDSTWREEHLGITTWGAATKGSNFKAGEPAFIVGYDGQLKVTPVILRKTSADTSWQKYVFPPPMPIPVFRGGLNDVTVPTSSIAFACGDFGSFVKTIDSGTSWFPLPTGTTRKLNAIDFYDERYGFVVGDSGTILFTSNGGVTSVGEEPDIMPKEFSLEQNYPNPFNPATEIQFVVKERGNVDLRIYDVLGREVKSLLSERMGVGTHKVMWDGRNRFGNLVSTGVYFYRLVVNDFVSMKRMILLK